MTIKQGDNALTVPDTMKAWILGGPEELTLGEKPVPEPGVAEVLVRIDAIAVCASDLELIEFGTPGLIEGELPFHKNHTPGHEYMGTVVKPGPGVDEFHPGQRVAVEVHAGCMRCKRCRMGMYTSCLNYGYHSKGHRANGFTTDGGFAQYAVNHVNTLIPIPDVISDEQATLIVTAGTSIYGLDVLGGLIAGESVVVTGAGAIGLIGAGVAKVLGADPVILTDIRDDRLEMGKSLGVDYGINALKENPVEAVHKITNGGADFVMECSGVKTAFNDAVKMVNRGGRVCLAAFAHEPVEVDAQDIVGNNKYVFGIRAEGRSSTHRAAALIAQGKLDPSLIHTHTFPLEELPTALKYAKERIENAIKVVVKIH